MTDATLRIESKFKNARLYRAIADASLPIRDYNNQWSRGRKISAFCRLHSFPLQMIYSLLNLRIKPVARYGGRHKHLRPRPVCVRLASILQVDLIWLFPPDLYDIEWPTTLVREVEPRRFVQLARAGSALALPPTQDDAINRRDCQDALNRALATLYPREANVLTRRYGLNGHREYTAEEVAAEFGVSRDRIRQIEAKALRKMRHPMRSRALRAFVV